jgi:hypothetical protein
MDHKHEHRHHRTAFHGKTLCSIGSYRIINYGREFSNIISIAGMTDTVDGESSVAVVQRSFRWSINGMQWSLWIDFTMADQTPLTSVVLTHNYLPKAAPGTDACDGVPIEQTHYDNLYIEFKYTVIPNPTASPEPASGESISPGITIGSIDLMLNHRSLDPYAGIDMPAHSLCSDEFTTMQVLRQNTFTFSPYNVNNGIRLYSDLSMITNLTFGWDVQYYRVDPQFRSKDVILHEFTLYNVQEMRCFKVLVPNNEFPDSKPTYNQFGIDFEIPFEIHVDRVYWENNFGKNTMPQKRDIIYFPQTNRIYEISSSYQFRDFMFQPLYFKISIVKYQPKADQILPENVENYLSDLTITTEELFGEEVKKEIEKITKPQQYVTVTISEDPTREKVNRLLPITRYDFYNNWTLVSEHYYNLKGLYEHEKLHNSHAIIYRHHCKIDRHENRAFTCWFSPQNNPSGPNQSNLRPLLRGRNAHNNGMDIDLVWSPSIGQSQIVVTMNANVNQFVLSGVTLNADSWYALVVNVSNQFGQVGVDLYTMTPPALHKTTELQSLYHKVSPLLTTPVDSGEGYKIVASSLLMTNIRIFGMMLELEHQSVVLNEIIVKDSNLALVIDGCRPLLRLPFVTNPK